MNDKQIYPISEMRLAALDTYELPESIDLYEHFKDILQHLPSWKYTFKIFPDPTAYRNYFIRYVNYFYSSNLVCIGKMFPDERQRKVAVALLAGFPVKDNGEFDKKVEAILTGKNESLNQCILEFLRLQGSDKWSTVKYLRDVYYKSLDSETEGLDGLKLKRLIEALRLIDDLQREFLKGDSSLPLNTSLIQRMEAEEIGLSPESIAQYISEGKSPLGLNSII